jgi:UDP-hydrolysing UDP-N-acetyl-D-glucosamine 2-epimerase
MADAFAKTRPQVVVVLGDRIEAFAAAAAASIGGIRVAHLHGGDRAEGVADEAMRHAISKLAHLHFPATPKSRRRLIRMGEDEAAVFCVGSPAADGLGEVEAAEGGPELIVMQHPVGEKDAAEERWMRQTLAATSGYETMVMAPNADPGCRGIVAALRRQGVEVVSHLPRERFLALLKGARAIVGNSSAGLIEAAVLKVPCVNIGPRQAGREKCGNVIDCAYGQYTVRQAIERATGLDLRRMRHPYGDGRCGERVAERLAVFDPEDVPIRKRNSY